MILYVVFVKFLRLGGSIPHFPVYLLLGIVMWTFFLEITTQGIFAIAGRGDLIRKINIPRWIILVSVSVSALINFFLNLIIVGVFMYINNVPLMGSNFLFPFVVLEVFLFSLGIALWLSTLYVKYRDISYIWEILMQGAFYLTPILYPLSLIGADWMKKLILLNPMAQAIQTSRYSLVTHDTETFGKIFGNDIYIFIPFGIIAFVLVTGVAYFRKESKYFAENV